MSERPDFCEKIDCPLWQYGRCGLKVKVRGSSRRYLLKVYSEYREKSAGTPKQRKELLELCRDFIGGI
jgi:hypothetical protein